MKLGYENLDRFIKKVLNLQSKCKIIWEKLCGNFVVDLKNEDLLNVVLKKIKDFRNSLNLFNR